MKLAIMQPYFFPYIGYWQLIRAVDRFVIYDDVNYIKRGWINRNRILINSVPSYITVPLHKSSQFKLICETTLESSFFWREKLIKAIAVTYGRAPSFADVFPVLERLIRYETNSLSEYLTHQLRALATLMGIETEFVTTSRTYQNRRLAGQERILDICKREQATTYVNPQGGQELYDPKVFKERGTDLRFLVMRPVRYRQRSAAEFVPNLSIIDVLMEVGPGEIRQQLDAFDLVESVPSQI